MVRRVTCDVSERFDICWMGLHIGRTLLINDNQGKQSHDERRRDRDLVKLLKAASDEAPAAADLLQTGEKQRVMKPGAVIEFTQSQLDRLIQCVDRPGWTTA